MARIAVVLTPGFADWEYALIGGTGGPFYGLETGYFAPQTGTLRSQGGLKVEVEQDLDALARWQPDIIAVIGGTVWETAEAPDLGQLIRDRHAAGGTIAGICGGTLALARAGLLDRVSHTSNDADFLKQHAEGYDGAQRYRESPAALADERVITAPGTAPVSFTAAVFDAAGVDRQAVAHFRTMLAAEHG